MSLLMDALKQAEHAKRGKNQDSAPPETPAASVPVERAAETPAALSLAPVETLPLRTAADSVIDAAPEPSPVPAASAAPAPLPAEPESEPAPAPREEQHTSTAGSPQPQTPGTQAAARLLAASASRQAALRRRNLLGGGALAAVLALAIGSYYYYAALAQPQPYLAPEQNAALLPDALAPSDESTAIVPDATPDAAATVASTPPVHTPWRAGPQPAPVETQPWEPAPVDPRVLRGEQPAPGPTVTEVSEAEAPAPAPAPAPSIRITRSQQPNQVSALLQTAYTDYRQGRWTQAEQGYRAVLAQEHGNRDARLGLAALAVRAGQFATARQHYRELLQRNPKDSAALAALSGLDQTSAGVSESELKLRLAEQPQAAHLHFALANLYAGQQRWPLAQQAYFEAQRLAPANPDYAFNLAVSLEHLGKADVALDYYRRALRLTEDQAARFDAGIAQQRIAALSAQTAP